MLQSSEQFFSLYTLPTYLLIVFNTFRALKNYLELFCCTPLQLPYYRRTISAGKNCFGVVNDEFRRHSIYKLCVHQHILVILIITGYGYFHYPTFSLMSAQFYLKVRCLNLPLLTNFTQLWPHNSKSGGFESSTSLILSI